MYYKLPIKDRMDLMKSYKKANPKMSYSDMVNDYNDSYQKFGNGGKIPKLKPKDFAAEKTNYEEQTRGASQADGSGISSAELAYKFSKLIDTSGLTSVTEIGKNAYLGNKQDPIDYLGLLRIPYVKEGVKQIPKLTKQVNKLSIINTTIGKTNDVVESYKYGGINKFEDGGIEKEIRPTADNTNVARSYFPNPDNTNMDTRRIPQSGMVVDKRTNQAYYFGDDGDTGTFPVLTAKNPEANKNTYSLSQLAKNSNLRSTPKGYYMVEKESKYKSKDDMQHYKGLMRSLTPIKAYGESKPSASDLALHLTFTDPGNPKVFKNREHLYNQVPEKRYASYGCVNCQEPSYRAFNKAVPESDTLMMLDSKDPKDLRLLKQAQSRIKTKIKD
jgi:hypothetical protein